MANDRRSGAGRPPGGIGVVVLYGIGALLVAMILWVATILPNWLATPVVAVALLGAALALPLRRPVRPPLGYRPGDRQGRVARPVRTDRPVRTARPVRSAGQPRSGRAEPGERQDGGRPGTSEVAGGP
jgi:hypothetical protein